MALDTIRRYPIERIDEVDNLILLCRVHHKMVDDPPMTYLADALREMKARHEKLVQSAVDSAVTISLEDYEGRSAVTARKTFVSREAFFRAKTPRTPKPLLDFSRTLLGRTSQTEFLDTFLSSPQHSICIFAGRGGIGKSKLLHDWTASLTDRQVVFLKDVPQWHADSYKEIPIGPVAVIVDDRLVALSKPFDSSTYLIPDSDVVAHLVLAHQTQMHNLITLTNYRTRLALYSEKKNSVLSADEPLSDSARQQFERPAEQLLRYMLFINEAPLHRQSI